jgi:ABC-type transporter Mla subunit MlaD
MQTPHFAATRTGQGLSGRSALSLGLPRGPGHWLRLASRIPSRKAAVATVWDLIRGSLIRLFAQKCRDVEHLHA